MQKERGKEREKVVEGDRAEGDITTNENIIQMSEKS